MHFSTIPSININLFYIIFCEVVLRKLFLLKLYCLFKLNRAIDMTDLINAHCVKLSQSIIIDFIGSGNHMTELTQLNCYLKKISVNSFLRTMNHCVHRRGYSWCKVTHIALLIKKSNIEFHGFLNELTGGFAVIRFKDFIYLFLCGWIYPQWDTFFGFTLHNTPFSHLCRCEIIVTSRYRVHHQFANSSITATQMQLPKRLESGRLCRPL